VYFSRSRADLCGFVYWRRYVGTIMLYASYDYKLVVLSLALALFLAYAALDSAARAIAMRMLWGIPRWWRKLRRTPDRAELSFSLLADAVPAILWTARADGSVDFISDKLYRYTGFRKERAVD
jgi:PAS domain-containing protein